MSVTVIVLNQIMMMFLMMALGGICYKVGLISDEGSKTLSNVALFLVVPFVVFEAFQIEYTKELLFSMMICFGLGLMAHLIPIVLSMIFVKKDENERWNIERFNIIYPNCGFMGIPIAQAMLGNKGVIYITLFMCAQNLLIWSHGVSSMRGGFQKGAIRSVLTAPVMIAMFLGFICLLLQIKLPSLLLQPIAAIADMNTPLAMIVSGTAVFQADLLKTLFTKRTYYIGALRLLLVPFCVLLVMMWLPVDKDIKMIMLLATSAPTAAVSTMFAVKYDRDVVYAGELFAIITLFAVITMPFMISLGQKFF